VSAIDRVRAVLEVSASIADSEHPLGRRVRQHLQQVADLSAPGIELALGEHLETDVTEDELAAFVARAATASRCHVLLSANVCTAAVRAIAWAAATAPDVSVKPSRRDSVVADVLIETLADRFAIRAVTELEPDGDDHVHLYGSDETLDQVQHIGGTVFAHGTGIGVATIDRSGDGRSGESSPGDSGPEDAALALCTDMVPFDGRGCLSPRIAFVVGNVHVFADALDGRLRQAAQRVPRGALSETERADIDQYGRTYAAVDRFLSAEDHFIAVDSAPQTLLLPPPHRGILLVAVDDAHHMTRLLEPWRHYVTCCGAAKPGGELSRRLGDLAVRHTALGAMQKPPFDGPVDLRSLR